MFINNYSHNVNKKNIFIEAKTVKNRKKKTHIRKNVDETGELPSPFNSLFDTEARLSYWW